MKTGVRVVVNEHLFQPAEAVEKYGLRLVVLLLQKTVTTLLAKNLPRAK